MKAFQAKAVSPTGLTSVAKAFSILGVLRRAIRPLSVSAIAEQVGRPISSVHSTLNQLLEEGAIIQAPNKRYLLGPETFDLGASFASAARVYRAVWTELVSVANELNVTAALAVPWGTQHLILAAHHGGIEVAVPFGGRVPITASSWGKVYFAWSGAQIPSQLPRFAAAAVVDRQLWARQCDQARKLGYATDRGEFDERVGGVAAPLTSERGYEGLGSLLAPLEQVDALGLETLGRRVGALTARASLVLGDQTRMPLFGSD